MQWLYLEVPQPRTTLLLLDSACGACASKHESMQHHPQSSHVVLPHMHWTSNTCAHADSLLSAMSVIDRSQCLASVQLCRSGRGDLSCRSQLLSCSMRRADMAASLPPASGSPYSWLRFERGAARGGLGDAALMVAAIAAVDCHAVGLGGGHRHIGG